MQQVTFVTVNWQAQSRSQRYDSLQHRQRDGVKEAKRLDSRDGAVLQRWDLDLDPNVPQVEGGSDTRVLIWPVIETLVAEVGSGSKLGQSPRLFQFRVCLATHTAQSFRTAVPNRVRF